MDNQETNTAGLQLSDIDLGIVCPMANESETAVEFVKAVLREMNLLEYFKFTWGRDTLPVSKPDPEVVRYGIHELGIEIASDVCMVGDNPVDTIAGKGAGAVAVAVSYGFSPVHILEKEAPDFLFSNFSDFSTAVKNS